MRLWWSCRRRHLFRSCRDTTNATTRRHKPLVALTMTMTTRATASAFSQAVVAKGNIILASSSSSWRRFQGLPQGALSTTTTTRLYSNSKGGDVTSSTEQQASSSSSSSTSPSPRRKHRYITYVTDIEGDRDYLLRYVRQSRVLCLRPVQQATRQQQQQPDFPPLDFPYDYCIDFVRNHDDDDDDILVFGGDVWDQGGHDYYVIRQLLHLHRRHPTRVYFVLGNRDVNKLRMRTELGRGNTTTTTTTNDNSNNVVNNSDNGSMPRHHHGVYWLRGTQRLGDPDLSQQVVDDENDDDMDEKVDDDQNAAIALQDPVTRCQWMLKSTMGSPRAFGYRKQELAELALAAAAAAASGNTEEHPRERDIDDIVTDEDVVNSYRQSCSPEGEMGQYLSVGHLAVQLGDVLFVHGSLPLTEEVLQSAAEANVDASRLWETQDSSSSSSEYDGSGSSNVFGDLTFAMPWLDAGVSAKQVGVRSIADWIVALNDFGRREMTTWQKEPPTEIWSTIGGYHDVYHDEKQEQQHHPPNRRTGCQLLQYGMGWYPSGRRNPTIVYNSWGTDGMPRRFFPATMSTMENDDDNPEIKNSSATSTKTAYHQATQSFFRASGIRLICSGHQPQGDMPNAICVPLLDDNDGEPLDDDKENDNNHIKKHIAWILCCDTSYSGDVLWCHDDNSGDVDDNGMPTLNVTKVDRQGSLSGRGKLAVSEVLLTQDVATGQITNAICHGVLSDGSTYETKPLEWRRPSSDETDNESSLFRVGTLAKEGPDVPSADASPHKGPWWTRAAFVDGSYMLAAGKGFDSWNRRVRF